MSAGIGETPTPPCTRDPSPSPRRCGLIYCRIFAPPWTWHGLVLRYDDPFWCTHYPPNGWNCRCTVTQYSDPDLERRGYAPTKRPAMPRRQWLNKRTGRVEGVPVGIDPGFQHNAGRVDLGQEAAEYLIAKIDAAPPDMRAAAIGRPWDTARFRRSVKGRGRPAEQAAPGDWPIALMSERAMIRYRRAIANRAVVTRYRQA